MRSGSAAAVREQLEADGALDVRAVEPDRLVAEVERALAGGATRVAVSGGDGTLASVARPVARAGAELAVIAGGTLNHFARHLGIPSDHAEAGRLAATGTHVVCADIAWLNRDRLVLNTSSIGAYVLFVRRRERLERWLGYYGGSIVAALWTAFAPGRFHVELSVGGETRRYETTLVFVSVGEREATRDEGARGAEGARRAGGERGLHVMVARAEAPFHLLRFALAAIRRGQIGEMRADAFDSIVTDRCVVRARRGHGTIAIDGELHHVRGDMTYESERDALRVVVP